MTDKFLKHTGCNNCGSSDANAIYERSDGSTYTKCFSCDAFVNNGQQTRPTLKMHTYSSIPDRGITKETCERYGCSTEGKAASFFYVWGDQTATKYRGPDKSFSWTGSARAVGLYGQQLFSKGGKYVTVTEGEFDALAAYQMLGSKYPVVSVKNGAQGALKNCKEQYEWLDSFECVVISFDSDEPGQKAAQEVAELFGPKAKIVKHRTPYKDANDYLIDNKSALYVRDWWDAETWKPEGIVGIADIKERLLSPQKEGLPWVFPSLTKLTYGRREGELYGFGAGVGVGKTDIFTESIAFDIGVLNEPVGVIYLEQPVAETVQRICGKMDSVRYHVPDAGWTRQQYVTSLGRLENLNKLWLFEHFGAKDWETIKAKIRYMHKSLGIRMIYLDHLTALTANADDERRALDSIMADKASLAQADGLIIHFISHLTTPEGKPHEEGGRVLEKHFTGSRAIARWSHFMFGLERDKQADDPVVRQTTTFRVLKDRFTGQATGERFWLRYDANSGRLFEVERPMEETL